MSVARTLLTLMPPASMSLRAWPLEGLRPTAIEDVDERAAGLAEERARELRVRHLGDDLVELRLGDAFERAAEENFAGADGIVGGVLAVDEFRQFERQLFVRVAALGRGLVLCFECGDVFLAAGR